MSKGALAKAAVLVTISEIIFNLSAFVIHAVVGRILGPEEYGRYGLVITLTTMVIILIGNGIPTAMSKYISEVFDTNPRLVGVIKKKAVILQSLLIGSVTLIFFLVSPLIATALGDPTLTPLFRISSLIIPAFAAASFYFSYYTGLHRFGIQSGLKIARSFFRVVFIIGLAYFFHVEGSIIGYILAPLSVFLVALGIDKFKVSRELKGSSTPLADFHWRKLTDYAWKIVLFFLAYELLISIDLYLVQAILRDAFQTGIWNASLTIGRVPYYLFYSLTVVLLPAISNSIAQKNGARTSFLINQSLRLMLILLVPAVFLMSAYSNETIRLFYSSDFSAAGPPMAVLVFGVGFLTVFYVLSFVMNGAGKVGVPMKIALAGFFLNAFLNFVLIRQYGVLGSAVATTIASIVVAFWMLREIKKYFRVSPAIFKTVKIIFAGILIYIPALFLPGERYLFILWSALLSAVYFAILYIFGEIKKEDWGVLKDIVSKKKKV